MKKKIFVLVIMIMTCLCACSKSDESKKIKEESILTNDTIESDVVSTQDEDDSKLDPISEETPYLVKNFDTDEIIGYLKEDDEIVQKVIADATALFKADTSMKPDTVEETLKSLKKNHQISDEILTSDFIAETVKQYKDENIQEDYYDSEITQLRFREDKNLVTVVATVSYLDTKMNLKICEYESAFEYNQKYDVWTYCGNYSYEEVQ